MGLTGSDINNVFSQLYAAGDVTVNEFALCINDKAAKSNGTLSIGGTDPRLHTGPFQYVSNIGGSNFGGSYVVHLDGLSVNGKAVSLNTVDAILDSGTNVLLLPTPAVDSLGEVLSAMCSSVSLKGLCDQPQGATLFDKKCFPLTDADISAYPPLTFSLDNGVSLMMHPEDYLVKGDVRANGDPTLVCLAVRRTGADGFLIIGDTLMRNYYIAYARDMTRVGFAPVNDQNCGNV